MPELTVTASDATQK